MAFLFLGDAAKAYIVALCILSIICLVVSLIACIADKSKRSSVVALSFLLVIIILNFAMLLQLNKIGREKYDITLTPIYGFFGSIPYFVYIALSVSAIIIAVVTIVSLYKNNKNKINAFSVKEALENLPTGIAFMTDDIELLLSNHIIHRLCRELTEATLQSGSAFWTALLNLQNDAACVIKGTEPAFALEDGTVWQFSKNLCRYDGDDYYEIKATDITKLYKLSENTRSVNEKLTQQQQRLKELTEVIGENTKKQVAVNMKINFHDNFGNLLTLTKKTIRGNENISETRALVDYWENLNGVIKELSSNDKQNITLEQIMIFADKLGCEIILNGELPKEEYNNTTILLCINEMLKNAYRHAGAQKLTVNISETDNETKLTIQNETKHRMPEIKEGGGLLGLRQRIEQAGGTMSMSCESGVSMFVKLFKGV